MKKSIIEFVELIGISYSTVERLRGLWRRIQFPKGRQLQFIQDFATWLNDGCAPRAACESIIKAGAKNRSMAVEVKAAEAILDSLRRGRSIAEGMDLWFDPMFVVLFDAGQKAGVKTLVRVISAAIKNEESIIEARGMFWKPLKTPAMYLGMVVGFMMILGGMVLPDLLAIIPRSNWPAASAFVVKLASWFASYWWLVIGSFGGTLFLASHLMDNHVSPQRLKLDGYFPLNIYRNFQAMRLVKTLGILVETRYSVHNAARELRDNGSVSPYLQYHLNYMIGESQAGETNLAQVMNSGILNDRMMFRLENAANSPDQDTKKSAITIAADRSGVEAVRALASTKTYMVIAMWVLLGVCFMLVAQAFVGVMTAVMSLSGSH